ncbi:hypothetical protein [Erythrobacter aureus]|uniref:Uncharacterized protein n=1 Tax=Erythrobacter aureus TaxID=2182384 RepID=A0A345YIP0_9SPHN|nr:hypothetical protein [Erythrobacter aureus]AXK43792.1 hypothetical protein DVR09_15155 [Erythrobacter aureus]
MAEPNFLDALRAAQAHLEASATEEKLATIRLHLTGGISYNVLWFTHIPPRGLSVVEALVDTTNGPVRCTIAITSLRSVEAPDQTVIVPTRFKAEASRIANQLADNLGNFASDDMRINLESSLLQTYRPYISEQEWIDSCEAASQLAA